MMRRILRALLCWLGEHPGGYLLEQGAHRGSHRCRACGRVYREEPGGGK